MITKLFVGRLSYETTDKQLQEAFEVHGKVVSVNIIQDRDSGKSKGFGFVEMADETEAKAAIAAYDGKDLGGRTIVVSVARPKENRADFHSSGSENR